MSGYVPCRPSADSRVHLYPAERPDQALCGRPAGPRVRTAPDGRICTDCARALVKKVFAEAGTDGVASIDITTRS